MDRRPSRRRLTGDDLAGTPLERLSPEGRAAVLSRGWWRRIGIGGVVQEADRPMSTFVVVLSGSLRVVNVAPNGHERIVRVLEPGAFIGETGLLLGHAPLHSAVAREETTVAVLSHELVDGLMDSESAFVRALLARSTGRLLAAELLLCATSGEPVMSRVADYLLDHRCGAGTVVTLPTSRTDIASYLGITPETLSRRLATLERHGALARTGPREYRLDIGRLRAVLAGETS